tara:strand:- start:842 stop:1246 length:405 start_codon:yes stop_codon:yes gene_type:complete
MITDLHLLVIHFPIALLSIAVLFDFLFYFTRKEDLVGASWWTMFFGVISCFVAVITGFVSDSLYEHLFSTFPLWENHGIVQIVSFLLFILLFYMKIYHSKIIKHYPVMYLVISGVFVLILFYGAHLGAVLSGRA